MSDGSLYFKPVPHRGTAKSAIGTVKGPEYELTYYRYTLCALQVFRIAYCDFYDPVEADTWQQICVGFVHTVKYFMPSVLRKQKVNYFLHLVESMENFGISAHLRPFLACCVNLLPMPFLTVFMSIVIEITVE